MGGRTRNAALAALILLSTGLGVGRADEAPVPANLQVAILGRMLAYDRGLKARAGASVGIGIVFKASDKESSRVQEEMLRAFKAMEPPTILGLPVSVLTHPYTDAADLGTWIDGNGIDALYVVTGLKADLDAIAGVCGSKQVVSMAGVRAFVEKTLAVGVTVKGENPKILVNLKVVESSGIQFDAKLLQLAEVLR